MERSTPKISVVVRTCQRPEVLRTALDSLLKQTFHDFEVVVVEDGVPTAQKMLEEEYSTLNYRYAASGKKTGRSCVGNMGLAMARGKYINFLDDDDAFLPNHLKTLEKALSASSNLAAYALAEERSITIKTTIPYCYTVKSSQIRFRQPFNRLLLYTQNFLPIQCVLFDRELYDKLGGFDEALDQLEDWDLWVRYSTQSRFTYVDEVTSIYHCPHEKNKRIQRSKGWLNPQKELIQKKFDSYTIEITAKELNADANYLLEEYNRHPLFHAMRTLYKAVFLGER